MPSRAVKFKQSDSNIPNTHMYCTHPIPDSTSNIFHDASIHVLCFTKKQYLVLHTILFIFVFLVIRWHLCARVIVCCFAYWTIPCILYRCVNKYLLLKIRMEAEFLYALAHCLLEFLVSISETFWNTLRKFEFYCFLLCSLFQFPLTDCLVFFHFGWLIRLLIIFVPIVCIFSSCHPCHF